MCGISSILSLSGQQHQHTHDQPNGNTKPSESKRDKLDKELRASLEQIRHRGPDATGTWISDDCRVGTLADSTLPPNPTKPH